MCLGIPCEVVELVGDGEAIVDMGSVRKKISTELLDNVVTGEYLLVHAGYALTKLDQGATEKTLVDMRDLASGRI